MFLDTSKAKYIYDDINTNNHVCKRNFGVKKGRENQSQNVPDESRDQCRKGRFSK